MPDKQKKIADEAVAEEETAAKTWTEKSPAKDEGEKPLTPDEIEGYRQLLYQKRKELVGDLGHMSEGALEGGRQDSSGELSSLPVHMADVGTDNYEQEFTLGLIESDRKLLTDIDRALGKIKNGTFGICEGTDEVIGRARLDAMPWARYSVKFAGKIERGLVRLPDESEPAREEEEEEAE
jgi:RNA polymerase-binding transcription factor DksA